MKRVSFEVAKALKEAGYPQGNENMIYLTKPCCGVNPGHITSWEVMSHRDIGKNFVVAPTYLEVWLWLWREKRKWIEIVFSEDEDGWTFMQNPSPCDCGLYNDPEEAIIAAIEHLVTNDLIK